VRASLGLATTVYSGRHPRRCVGQKHGIKEIGGPVEFVDLV
jgi:hypothetical protein